MESGSTTRGGKTVSWEETTALNVSFDGVSWQAQDAEGNSMPLPVKEGQWLPQLPDGNVVESLLLPAEQLLSRTIKLPLPSPRFIDADVLAQELDEYSGEDINKWWLSWQAASDGDLVRGILFGLPRQFRDEIDGSEAWQQLRFVGADIQVRLNAQLSRFAGDAKGLIAVFDVDCKGLVFGLCRRSGNDKPVWLGMRRLNLQGQDEQVVTQMADEIRRSLIAMGWHAEMELVATGVLESDMHAALLLSEWAGDTLERDELPDRHAASLSAGIRGGLNFRHGRWRARTKNGEGLASWYGTMVLAAALLLVWSVGMIWQNYQLNSQSEQLHAQIIDAFHRGLPNETVIIDPLAQLRKAAGTGGESRSDALLWMQQLAGINRVYKHTPWEIRKLSFQDGKITMSGEAKDLQTMNKIRKSLQQETGKNVQMEDTDLNGSQVKFRMVWS